MNEVEKHFLLSYVHDEIRYMISLCIRAILLTLHVAVSNLILLVNRRFSLTNGI